MDEMTADELQRTLRRFGAAAVLLLSIVALTIHRNDAFFASEIFGQAVPWAFLSVSLGYLVLTIWGALDRSGLFED